MVVNLLNGNWFTQMFKTNVQNLFLLNGFINTERKKEKHTKIRIKKTILFHEV